MPRRGGYSVRVCDHDLPERSAGDYPYQRAELLYWDEEYTPHVEFSVSVPRGATHPERLLAERLLGLSNICLRSEVDA